MKILILTGSFGMGHNSSAMAIKQEVNKKMSGDECQMIDINQYIFPVCHHLIYKVFELIVHKFQCFYNVMYKKTQHIEKSPLDKFYYYKIRKLIKEYTPDLIISTLPMSSHLISNYKKISGSQVPLITCITDISVHNSWINEYTNAYLVASDVILQQLIEKGIDESIIYITGIPVKEDFKECKKVGNQLAKKRILMMGGGCGILPFAKTLYRDLNKAKTYQVTIICGENKKLYKKLKRKYKNIEVLNYCKHVEQYMANADLIITKPGCITLFEAIYSQLPLLVICPFLEQEIENAQYIENQKIGRVVWDKNKNLTKEISYFISDQIELSKIRERMQKIQLELSETNIRTVIEQLRYRGKSDENH